MKPFLLAAAATLLFTGAAHAQAPTPLSPAPTLSPEKDSFGRPVPFGRPEYKPGSTPMGGGPLKAVMAVDDTLPAHVIYYPADLPKAGKLPIVAWGNGACINAGNRFRIFLTEIASHGYFIAANGVLDANELEVGPQENPAIRAPGAAPPPPPPPPNPNAPQRAPGTTTAAQLTESIDWAIKENSRQGSKFYGRLDTSKIAVMGQSCGGVQALNVAGDPRLTTMVIWNSGAGMIPNNPATEALSKIHTPIAFISGDQARDIAYPASKMNFETLETVPVFWGWQDGMTHIGTYGAPGGGSFGRIAVAWLDWRLKGDEKAAAMFKGKDCLLCREPSWHVFKKKID
jgi:dienelactone hydrolase